MTTASAHVQRTRHRVPGFDPHNDAHVAAVEAKLSDEAGTGFRVVGFDPETQTVTFERTRAVTEVAAEKGTTRLIASLRTGAKPSDGEREAIRLENQNPGYTMTRFEPHLSHAVLEKLPEDAIRCRGAVAVSLAVKPWQVQVARRRGGGFILELPTSYVPSRHDGKLTEVAENVIGQPGWYVDIDAKALTAQIIPAQPPTFPAMIPYPFDRDIPTFTSPADTAWTQAPLGCALGRPGDDTGPEFRLDLASASHTLLQGLPMSGKSVNINAFAYWMLQAGAELAIVDTPDKAVDFEWIRPYVRDGGWGCESYEAMVATCGMVYAEGKRRAAVLKRRGINNWFSIRDDPSFRPIVLIADEYTGLMTPERVPKALPKDHPMRVEAEATNGFKDMVATFIQKIALEMRFVGVHVFVSTQLGNTKTGVSTALKAACGNRFLMGPNVSDNQRANAFSAPDSVAEVPENVEDHRRGVQGRRVSPRPKASPHRCSRATSPRLPRSPSTSPAPAPSVAPRDRNPPGRRSPSTPAWTTSTTAPASSGMTTPGTAAGHRKPKRTGSTPPTARNCGALPQQPTPQRTPACEAVRSRRKGRLGCLVLQCDDLR